jgi:hypothetical protein
MRLNENGPHGERSENRTRSTSLAEGSAPNMSSMRRASCHTWFLKTKPNA